MLTMNELHTLKIKQEYLSLFRDASKEIPNEFTLFFGFSKFPS